MLPSNWNKTFNGFLHKIEVTACNLTGVESYTFTHIEGLQAIDLGRNEITHLAEKSFSGLTDLVTINLENNLISSLPEGIFDGLSNLENILLKGNRLTSIDALAFSNIHNLKGIDLSRNQIRHISDDAMGEGSSYLTHSLAQIDISENELAEFPTWLLQLRFLTNIDFSHNRISFEGLKSALSRIPSIAFFLYRNGQQSGSIYHNFFPTTMKIIKFRNNTFTDINISTLSDDELYKFQLLLNYYQLDFAQNPLHCDCKIYTLYEYLRGFDIEEPRDPNRIAVLPYNMNSIVCQHPDNLHGIPLVTAPPISFGCYIEVQRCPQDCQCWVRTVDEAVKVICSNKSLTQLPEPIPYDTIELNLSGNSMMSLPQDVPDYIISIAVLDFSDNLLSHLDGSFFEILTNTSELKLQGNRLTYLPVEVSPGHL